MARSALFRTTAGFAVLIASMASQAQTSMQPGGWEMVGSITRELPGKPAESLGTQTTRLCLTPEFIAREPYLTPAQDEAKAAARGATCANSEYQRDGNAAQWVLTCALQDGSRLRAHIRNVATDTTLTQRMVQDVERPDGSKGRVTLTSQGRRSGDCTDDMPRP